MANNPARTNNHFTMKTKYGAMAATTIPFIILGGAYLALAYINGGLKRRERHRVMKKSVSLGVLHGGKLALQRLIDYEEARADSQKLKTIECQLRVLLKDDNPNFLELQRTVAKMEMSGHEDKAVQLLREERLRARKEQKMHETYEIEMLLVEMLIYMGEFRKAFSCKCLSEENISDARRPLYKAVILLSLERPRNEILARQNWEKFREIREDFDDPPCLKESMQQCMGGDEFYKLATNFDEFKKVVKRLKDDIHSGQVKKKKRKNLYN